MSREPTSVRPQDGAVPPPAAASVSDASARPPLRTLTFLFLGSRLLVYLFAAAALWLAPKPDGFLPPRSIADWFLRWDALWYFDVAEHGYHYTQAGATTNVVFFPLYPWLLRAASLNGAIDYRFAGYAVSLCGLWLASVWLWRLVAREWRDARLATWSVAFLLFGPVTFFFSTLYSESWFLPLVIGCLAAARERRWWLAGVLGALAAFTRFIGIVLVVPLLWECVAASRDERGRWSLPPGKALAGSLLPLGGFAAYTVLMWAKFGDPLLYFHAQQHWARHFTWFWQVLARQSYWGLSLFYQVWFAGWILAAFGALLLGVWQRLPTTYLVFALTFAFVYVSANGVEALPRYLSVLFPFYVIAALSVRRSRAAQACLLASSIALEALSVGFFVSGHWFT